MLRINVSNNFAKVAAKLRTDSEKQVKHAAAVALTRTAQAVQSDIKDEMRKVFDRPTAWTMNSLYVRPATKHKLEARVWLKDDAFKGTPASRYLSPQIYGGERKLKRFEKSLQNAGLLPPGMYAVPGQAAQLDAHGNMSKAQIVQIMAYLRAFGQQGYKANMTDAGRARMQAKRGVGYFVGRPGGKGPLGVWARFQFASGSAVKPVAIFVKAPKYKGRLRFFDVANRAIDARLEEEFHRALRQALSSMR